MTLLYTFKELGLPPVCLTNIIMNFYFNEKMKLNIMHIEHFSTSKIE